MKIIHWDEMFHPAFGYQINLLAKFQAEQGHEVVIVTSENVDKHPTFAGFGNSIDISREDDIYSKKYGVKIIRLPIHGVYSGRVIYKRGYLAKIKELSPDVIMCHTNDTLSAIRIAQKYKYLDVPIVFDNHMLEIASKNPLRWLFRLYFRTFVTPIIIRNKWIVIKTQKDEYVNRHLGIPNDQTPFLSFGSDTTVFYPDEKMKSNFRRIHNISPNDFVVLYAGKLSEDKGGRFLAEAIVDKFALAQKIVFIIVGNSPGTYGASVEEIFERSENVVLRFPTQKYMDLAEFYQSADLSIFPKQCSLSFYDAQACALPVVSEDISVNNERLQSKNGFVFEPDNGKDFRSKIEYCANLSQDEFAKIKENAYKYATENYNFRDIAKKYTEIIQSEYARYNRCEKSIESTKHK
jgi:glycosyltransferase involved in cell wall biosynthesis